MVSVGKQDVMKAPCARRRLITDAEQHGLAQLVATVADRSPDAGVRHVSARRAGSPSR